MQIPFKTLENYYDLLLENEAHYHRLQNGDADLEYLNPRDYLSYRIGFVDVFNNLNKLLEINPKTIVDIGCGCNHFKNFIPNLIGVDPKGGDPNYRKVDIARAFNTEFSNEYKHSFHAAFSINSIHFITLDYMKRQILEFANIIKPGGRGYIALNLARMVEDTPYKKNTDYLLELFGTETPDINQCRNYVKKELDTLDLDVLTYEIDFTIYDAYLNGNIRLIFNV